MRGLFIFVVPGGLATFATWTEKGPYPIAHAWLVSLVDAEMLPAVAWLLITMTLFVPWIIVVGAAFSASPAKNPHRTTNELVEVRADNLAEPGFLAVLALSFLGYAGWGYSNGLTAGSTETLAAGSVGAGYLAAALAVYVIGSN